MTRGQRKFTDALGATFHYALDLLAPERCLFCDQLSGRDLSLCDICESALIANKQACPHCALPDCGGALCPSCLKDSDLLPRIVAPYVYDPMIGYLMQRWKYGKERRLAKLAARLMADCSGELSGAGIVLPTPLHWRRYLSRGFNQSEDLLDELQRQSKLRPPSGRRLIRLRRTQGQAPQARATRRERVRQVADLFATRGRLRGESVTLIDDVCTTGATAAAMTQALRRAGAGSVTLLCLARTPVRAGAHDHAS